MMFVFLFLVGNFALGQFGGSTPTGQDSALLRLAPMDYFDYLMKADRPFAEAVGLAQNYIMANENRPEINRLKKRMGRFYNFWYSRMAPTERVSEANLRGIDRAVSNRCAPPNILAPAWQQLGPVVLNEEIEGRFNRVYSPQGSPTIIYAAGSAGGLFKTTNSGGDWENVTDGIGVPGLGINDMIADPSDPVNTLYIATGYLGLVFEPATSYGAGIYKTTNGGTTWILCASTANALYTKLLIAKDGTNTIIYGLTMDKLYKTTDDWQTKTDLGVMNFQPLPNNTQEIYTDMAVVPSNPYSVIVTSLGGGVSPLAHTVVCGNTAATVPAWHELVYPSHLNTNPIAMSVDRGPLTNDTRLFVCAYSYHAYPTELYAVNFDMAGNETVALPLNLQIPSESRINGEFVILPNGADPSLPIEIYLPLQASIRFIELTPSGASYNTGAIVGGTATVGASVQLVTGSMHNDFRGLDFNNVNRSTLNHTGLYEGLLVVNDGGVVRYGTYNSALIWKNLLGAATRPLTGHELYGLSLAQNKQPNGLNIFTGGVDNGSFGYRVTSGVGAWAQIGGTTDGNDPIIDWSDNTNYFYKTLATHTFYSANNNSINPGGTGWLPFYTTQDPIRPKIIIVAEKDWIKRYSYTPTTGFILLGTGSILPQTTLSGIAIAPTNSDVVYVTTSWNRTIHRSTDGGLTFAQSHDLGHAWITAVAIDPTDENQLTVATGGFNTGIAQGSCNGVEKVWHISYDPATQTFTQTDISAGICNAPINSVKYQTGANALGGAVLWAGTDMGVYRYEPSTGVWESYNTGFPYCLVNDIEIDPCEGKIYASTYGRGVWKNDLPNFSPTTFPSVSIASNVTDCEAVLTATIANQASTVHNFLWSTGEIATSPTALTNAIAVHHSGTYTVIASGGGTCVATASIAVSVFEPTVTLTSSITTPLCANTSVTLQAGVGNPSLSNAVWHWGALSSSIGSAITILPQGAGGTTSITTTYTVTVTDGATCTATGSIDITVLNNCCPVPPPFQEIQPRSATASQIAANIAAGKLLPNVAAASTAQQIVISGQSGSELVIDDDYTFFNSTIQLGTGCKITVATGKTLTLLGCTVESCGASLWDKMEVLGGGTLLIDECVYTDRSGILVRKPTTIKDGDNGIYVKEENATLAIKNAVFESNYVSIYLDGTDIQTSATLPISFQCNSTVFKGVADIGSTKIAAVHTGIHYPATGLFLLNAHISLNPISLDPTDGVISGGSTLFTDMTNGILSIDSDINLGACRFVNLHNFDTDEDGVGIGALSFGAGGTNAINFFGYQAMHHFESCDYGIKSTNTAIYANYPGSQGVSMQNVKYGIAATESRTLDIRRSTINATYRGIEITSNTTNPNIDVQQNSITVNDPNWTSPTNSCVICLSGVAGASAADYSNTRVKDNMIVLRKATTGISLTNVNGIIVKNNSMDCLEPAYNKTALHLSGCDAVQILDNTAQGFETQAANDYTGIRIEQSTNTLVECNTTGGLKTGIRIEGPCGGTNLQANSIGDHTNGIYYNSVASTGPQDYKGNIWTGNYTGGYGAQNDNTLGYLNSKYTYNPNTAPPPTGGYYYPPLNSVIPSDWFQDRPFQNNAPCPLPGHLIGVGGNVLHGIAEETDEYVTYDESLKWVDKRYLLNELEKQPALLQDSILSAFKAEAALRSEGKYHEIAKATKEAVTPEVAEKALLQTYELQLRTVNNDMLYIDSLLTSSADPTTQAALKAQYTLKAQELEQLQALQATTLAAVAAGIAAKLPALIAQNNATSFVKQYEENDHAVNSIYYDKYVHRADTTHNYTLSAAQKSTLLSIAAQCPYFGGNAVFAARAMISTFDKTYYDDHALCLQQGVLWRTQKPKTVKEAISDAWQIAIYPNPANEQLTVALQGKHGLGKTKIYDVYGRLVTEQGFQANTNIQVFDVEKLSTGFYLIKVEGDNIPVTTKSIIILK